MEVKPFRFSNDFAEARGGGTRTHEGVDIIAPKLTPFIAVADGIITYRASPEPAWGYALTLEDSEGYHYKYLHVNNDTPGTDDGRGGEQYAYAPGIVAGSNVVRGQVLGWVGDSGNAESVGSHLHFEMYAPGRVLINPYESLILAAGGVTSGDTTQTTAPRSAAAASTPVSRRQLQEGDRGSDVRALNDTLVSAGLLRSVSGELFTSDTREAVRAAQVRYELPTTGIADVRTQEALARAVPTQAPPATQIAPLFTKDLEAGMTHAEVRSLQRFLNARGFTVAPSGQGSPGNESTYFGSRTKAALSAFQKANGIVPAAGYFGPKTRALIQTLH
jgi:peptidoglycan hydrolase-like protein with peptidoglycan-binding domain